MSFILESIKQAERERKLGQQAPSIASEYSGAHVEDIDNNKIKWVIMSLALLVTAMVVWGATQYFANKDRQYIEELALSNKSSQQENLFKNNSAEKTVSAFSSDANNASEKRDVLIAPVKNVHTSDLKSVRLISADEEAPKTTIDKVVEVKKPETKKLGSDKKVTPKVTPAIASVAEPAVEIFQPKIETARVAGKQELAEIYSDLSKLAKQESVVNEPKYIEPEVFERNRIDKELVEIETASYVTTNKNKNAKVTLAEPKRRTEVTPVTPNVAPKHAVSSGLPSFGELPYDIQDKIPSFNVSVHMFHADPNQRRIRINGNMYMEGKSLQQDLALVEITRFGAVFDYQGHLFRLNVR